MIISQKNLMNSLILGSLLALGYVTCALIVTGKNIASDQHAIAVTEPHAKLGQDQANTYQKPGAPVRLVSQAKYSVAMGDPLSLDLEFSTQALGSTKVVVSADEGLHVEGNLSQTSEGQSQLSLPLTVTAHNEQLGYLHLYIEYTGEGGYMTARNLIVSIDSRNRSQALNEAALRKVTEPKPFVEMQATETIY